MLPANYPTLEELWQHYLSTQTIINGGQLAPKEIAQAHFQFIAGLYANFRLFERALIYREDVARERLAYHLDNFLCN